MARIPESEIERLKKEIAVERLAEARGIQLRRHGADLLGLCPFHDDHEPSLVISPAKNLWHCLGACQTGGSVIDWVMRAEGISFRHAVELLRRDFSFAAEAASDRPPPKKCSVPKLPTLLEHDADDEALLRQVVGYYHGALKESPEALDYLEKRGLRHAEMIETFHLGFANRTLGYRLPHKAWKAGAELRGRLQRLGLMRESGHEHFCGSIVIPVIDSEGHVTEMYGRKVTPNLRKGTPLHLYLPGPHKGVWNEAALAASSDVVLCEALIDALTFWCAGIRNVTSAYGVEGFTEDHWVAFRTHGVRRVWIAYDRDEAGDKAAEKLSAELAEEGIETLRVEFPRGMDANEYALKVGPAEKSLALVVRNASWMRKGTRKSALVALETKAAEETPQRAKPAEQVPPAPFSSFAAEAAEKRETAAPPAETTAAPQGEDVLFRFGDRQWRVRGLGKNTSFDALKVNVLVSREGAGFFVDTLEMYSARQRAAYIKQASEELEVEERVLKKELGELLLKLEAMREEMIAKTLAPKEAPKSLSDEEREAALELLRDPRLLDRILEDFERCGVVGERTNKLVGYLAATSRKLEEPLAVVIQSSSAAGKSSLMEAVLSLMPEEERISYSAMTGQSLYYMGERDLQHKILAIAEEEGAEKASYALKLLQSEGQLTIASTGKEPATGKLVTHEYRVEGPVMIFLTTTAIEVDEELLNRCIVLTVDEGREQTRAIHVRQRASQTIEGLLRRQDRGRLLALHQNAQRLLRPLLVANPLAEKLTFSDGRTRTRRDHMKYLTLIRAVCLLHQYQRPLRVIEHQGRRVEYIEVREEDIAHADRLVREVLGRSLDELAAQTRRLLRLVETMVKEQAQRQGVEMRDVRFTRRDVREYTGWGHTQLKVHLGRLEEHEYLLIHRTRHAQRHVYELAHSSSESEESEYDENRSGVGRGAVGGRSGRGRWPVGPWSAPL